MPKLNSRCQALHSSLEASKEKFFEMAEAKSVRFSPIIEETIDDISTASSNMDFFPSGMNFEDAYIASLSKSAKKYHLPNENEQRLLQRRKKGLLALGFVLLLGITGAGIYLVTRELSNQEPYYYSGAAVRGSKPEFATKNMTLHFLSYSATILSSSITKKPSLEYGKTQASVPSVKASSILRSKPRGPITGMLTPTTITDSSSLKKITETNRWNTSSFLTPSFAFVLERSSYFVMSQDSVRLIIRAKTITSLFVTQGSSWKDYNTRKSVPSAWANSKIIFLTSTGSSVGVNRSSLPDIRTSSSFGRKAGSVALSITPYSPLRNSTLVKESQRSSYSRFTFPWYSSQTVNSSDIATFKLVSNTKFASNDFQPATEKGELSASIHSRLTSHPPESFSESRNPTEVAIGGMLLETTLELPNTKIKVFSYPTSSRIINSPGEDRPITILNQLQTSYSRNSTALTNDTRETFTLSSSNPSSSLVHTMHSNHHKTSSKMHGPISTEVSQDTDVLLSYTSIHPVASGSVFQEQSSQNIFKGSIQKTMFPSSSFIGIHTVSKSPREIKKNLRPSSTIFSRESDLLSLQATSDSCFHSVSSDKSHNIHAGHNSERSTVVKILSLKSTGALPSVLQPSPSHGNKTLFDTTLTLSLMTKISSSRFSASQPYAYFLSSYFHFPAVKPVLPYASSSMNMHHGITSTVVFKKTITNHVSSRSVDRKSFNFSSTHGRISASMNVNSRHTGNIGFSIIPVRSISLTSEASSPESASTPNLFIGTTLSVSMQTSTKGTSDKPVRLKSASTSAVPVSASNPSVTSSKDVWHFSRSLPTGEKDESLISSRAEESKLVLSTMMSSDRHLKMNVPFEKSQSRTPNTPVTRFSTTKTSTAAHSLITALSSSEMSIWSTLRKTSRGAAWQGKNSWDFRVNVRTSTFEHESWKSSTGSFRTIALTAYVFPPLKTIASSPSKDSSNKATIWKVTNSTISTGLSSMHSTALSLNLSTTISINVTSRSTSETPWNISVSMQSLNATAHVTSKFPSNVNYTPTSHLRWVHHITDQYPYSSVKPTTTASWNSSNQFEIMDGSLVIKNRDFHANLSNPNSTMFKVLADKVEVIVEDIISVDAKVTSFEEGSVIALFYLKVPHDALHKDSDYLELLRAANETLWQGLVVVNITVTLRVYRERAESQDTATRHFKRLSNAAFIAIFTFFFVLLIAVGGFGVYICKKKGYCERSTVKPADSSIPPSEPQNIQPVRRDTWVMSDEIFKDHDQRSVPFYETLSMRVLERKDTNKEGGCNPDLLRKYAKSPFEPNYSSGEVGNFTTRNTFRSTSRCTSSSHLELDDSDRPVSGSSRDTYLNSARQSSHSEDEC